MQLIGIVTIIKRCEKWNVEAKILPVSLLCQEENNDKLAEVDEEGVKDPEEGEEGPVGMSVVICQEVEQECLSKSGISTLKKMNLSVLRIVILLLITFMDSASKSLHVNI